MLLIPRDMRISFIECSYQKVLLVDQISSYYQKIQFPEGAHHRSHAAEHVPERR